jgi:hypothetical protein
MFHFFLDFLPFCHHTVTHLACLKFNPVWQHYLKVHHLHCSG